jgi:peptidoglycan/LPS O-acetylase OafA/YrhL
VRGGIASAQEPASRGDAATPDAVAPPPHHPRFPEVDGLRAVAVLAVVLVHVAVFSPAAPDTTGKLLLHLNLGVTIFFLISGFLLYRPFIAHRSGGPVAPATPVYAWRRALRIFPAYWLFLIVLAAVPGVTGALSGGWPEQFALVQTLPIFDGPACSAAVFECGAAQTWSLAVELSFYAALPLLALVFEWLSRGGRREHWARNELLALGLLAAVSTATIVLLDPGDARAWVSGTAAGYMLWFGLGMALAIASAEAARRRWAAALERWTARLATGLWLAAAAVYMTLALFLPPTPFLLDSGDELLAHLGFALVALLLIAPMVLGAGAGLPGRLMRLAPVAWLGLISYGIFLWHFPVLLLLGNRGEGLSGLTLLAATLAITVACAAASYYALERPVLRLKRARRLRRSAEVPAGGIAG